MMMMMTSMRPTADKVTGRAAAYVAIFLVYVSLSTLHSANAWRNDRRPKFFGDKVPVKMLNPVHQSTQKKIVMYHNFFRSRVHPPAADMLAMTWHGEAARDAQRWADQCQFLIHDNVTGRWVDDFGSCGQNIFVSTHQVPWMFATKTWFLEKHNFTYGSPQNNLFEVGHYTQMVWAATHKVGCGFTKCPYRPDKRSRTTKRSGGRSSIKHPKYFYNYVCNYCPIGNYMERLGRPYKKGPSCGRCKGSCKLRKLCTNSCSYADLWVNCRELNTTWNQWLCHNNSKEGLDRKKHCRATCECTGKIYTQLGRIKA
ncbi:hypothetical protein GHT06_012898 [Daphnia sinensis]|uniref:SCP domain-containing protein n=1 Tax=Daphnia sinensis TaxID=1820382 RepID=A0AAD5LH54_9CRUS|nr:hypothetical protein GHT06_012898 [Daphnia sinensis]